MSSKREEPVNQLPRQVRADIAQAEHLMVHTPWEKAVMVGGKLFLRR
ncbi:MAG: hypothetical protein ACT4QF_12725 [Sporichthyaceae bacterium]|jgi:hypothetical protein